ncbi:MAG: DUF192 domain-containing protein [Patescibacteria group bacterium]
MDIRHKSFAWKATVCSIIALIMVISAGWAVLRQASTDYKDRATLYDVKVGDLIIPVEIADTPETLEKGLSGRFHLPKRQGLLFLFPTAEKYAFWMPDMNFPIDLLWIDADKRIVGIEESMKPEKNLQDPRYYTPPEAVGYVIELNAGFVKKHGITVGQEVIIPEISTGHRALF